MIPSGDWIIKKDRTGRKISKINIHENFPFVINLSDSWSITPNSLTRITL